MVDDLLINYVQPDQYHFSQESIGLSQWASQRVNSNEPLDILDVGAGCGVVGIEWFYARNNIDKVTLIEKQSVFLSSQKENIKGYEQSFLLLNEDFLQYKFKTKLDVILTNPPYFIKERSRPSVLEIRNTCRQIEEVNLKKWFSQMFEILKDDGHLFFVFRNDEYKWLSELVSKFNVRESLVRDNYCFNEWRK